MSVARRLAWIRVVAATQDHLELFLQILDAIFELISLALVHLLGVSSTLLRYLRPRSFRHLSVDNTRFRII